MERLTGIDRIGVLPRENEAWRKIANEWESAFVNVNKQIQYAVQPVMRCDENESMPVYFTGYIHNLDAYGFEENYDEKDELRGELFKQEIGQYLFVFNATAINGFDRISEVALVIKPRNYEEGMVFQSIPFYSTTDKSIDDFIRDWKQRRWMGTLDGIDKHRKIPFVLWRPEGSQKIYCVGGKTHLIYHKEELYAPEVVHYYELTQEETHNLILNPRNPKHKLAFVESGLYDGLIYEMERKNGKKEVEVKQLNKSSHTPISNIPEKSVIKSGNQDSQLLANLRKIIAQNRFSYQDTDLVNFHTALKTKSLVILEGMSGTGKSRLVDFYRQALGLDEKHYKCISVKASWTDESDLIGYPDMMNQDYHPDHEGVVDLLIDAEKNPDELYLLCFDEMNLARVEHYFSQFLSILEMNEDQQILNLYNEYLELKNKVHYPPSIQLRGNVLFVGTVNKDESTHHFSDKVLDRANVIRLGVANLKDLYSIDEMTQDTQSLETTSYLTKDYFGEKLMAGQSILKEDELSVLDEINQMLMEAQYEKGIGYRILRQIESYMHQLPEGEALSREQAFDLQVAQRILSKLRGDCINLEGVLIQSQGENSPLQTCLEAYSHISNFEVSKKIISQKVKALKSYGYTI